MSRDFFIFFAYSKVNEVIILSKLGFTIRKLRDTYGLTQLQLGEKIGVAESTISLYESGKREPDISTLELIANFFKVTIDYLLGRTDDIRPITTSTIPSEDLKTLENLKELSKEDRELVETIIKMRRKQENEEAAAKSS